jgi:hypothetical protein
MHIIHMIVVEFLQLLLCDKLVNMLRILAFLACIILAMTASVSRQTIINAGGMFIFESDGPDVPNQSRRC